MARVHLSFHAKCWFLVPLHAHGHNRSRYLDVAADAEVLLPGGVKGVGHLFRGGLHLLLDRLLGDTLDQGETKVMSVDE